MKLNVKVKIPKFLSSPREIASELTKFDAQGGRDGQRIVQMIKTAIAQGRSPVQGKGPFIPYASERDNDPRKYPGNLKPSRPVNLSLTGQMLRYYAMQITSSLQTMKIGLINAPKKIIDRAMGNNLGNPDKNVPERRFIPQEGERFTANIEKEIASMGQRNLNRNVKKIF